MNKPYADKLGGAIISARATGIHLEAKGIFYECNSDDLGARIWTNLITTACPRCGRGVTPNVEHLCGNRAPKVRKKIGGAA